MLYYSFLSFLYQHQVKLGTTLTQLLISAGSTTSQLDSPQSQRHHSSTCTSITTQLTQSKASHFNLYPFQLNSPHKKKASHFNLYFTNPTQLTKSKASLFNLYQPNPTQITTKSKAPLFNLYQPNPIQLKSPSQTHHTSTCTLPPQLNSTHHQVKGITLQLYQLTC